jgi:ABC-2 type transport system ATP-binding protein
MHAIEVDGLTKAFRGVWRRGGTEALRGVSLAVATGTAFGIIGPNGAGKTTLVKILLGIVRPTSGSVAVLGGSPDEPRVRRRIGYVPERLHFPRGATATSFLHSVARLRGVSDRVDDVQRQLGRVGLVADGGRRVSTFSKGMRQRLGVAAALLGAPDLLILDEPTDGIDPLGRADVRRLLQEESKRGATVLINSHLLSETERSCQRIGILVQGQVARVGDIGPMTRSESRWRARFVDGDPVLLQQAGFEAGTDGWWSIEARDVVLLDSALRRARDAGAKLIELQPEVRELEEILADAVGERSR